MSVNNHAIKSVFSTSLTLMLSFAIHAQADDTDLWFSEVELGAVATTGNTDERNLKLRADIVRNNDSTLFKQKFHINLLNSSKDDEKTAQKFYGAYALDYKLDDKSALSGRISYEDDRFSGFDYQTDATLNYARTLLDTGTMKLEGSAGAGLRVSVLENGDQEEEGIVRFAGNYHWQLNEHAAFEQSLSMEIGSESTITRSESSIRSNIIGDLAMKVALNIKHQSQVPLGSKKTDTETSMTIVYKF